MNTLKTAVAALLIAVGTITAFAFTKAETKTEATLYYWFDGSTYLGQDTKANIQDDHCGTPGLAMCARAYSAISGSPGSEVPSGPQVDNTTRQP
ncbi:hypothetical protein [Chryseobacterium viscerum]|uniref:Uncharacterized protein n=1 Tax=Chryseobacterium viscerum TaxID=1037377 RepID=A0A316WYR4_9FLAO|nr:hypothetical protein [Chryseobacterium viscerum]PWN64128.1 hypothetical protein C1634_005920 [Chryseobacterium viscerum]